MNAKVLAVVFFMAAGLFAGTSIQLALTVKKLSSRECVSNGSLELLVELAELERNVSRLCDSIPAIESCVPCPLPPRP